MSEGDDRDDRETPATTFDGVVQAIAHVPTAAIAPGQVLEETYEIVERIGGGGMGIVFRARDRRLGRDVALKMSKATSASDEQMRRMFEREARATAQLLHPNIVTLHHVGEHERQLYLVLELLNGETLASRLARRGRLPESEALSIIDAVLAALAYAHERGVLHRDLKPNNVFITVDERIKVLDFGLVLDIDTDPGPVTRLAGTPGYMAPEQRAGSAQDTRTDVWATAVLLVECLLGRRPDEASVDRALAEVDVKAPVRAVLARALSTDPDNRPETAADFRAALSRASGRLSPAVDRPRTWARRARLAALGVGAAAMGLAAGYALKRSTRTSPSVTAAEINGRAWHVNYGELLMHIDPDGSAYGVYDREDGRLIGTFAGGTFTGWWCELPTFKGPKDAGQVKLHFVHGHDRVLIDGIWTYGDGQAASWQKDFYGVSLDKPPEYQLEQRMQAHVPCPPR